MKKLTQTYEEYKKLLKSKGYSDGGETAENLTPQDKAIKAIRDYFSPTPTPKPLEPTLDEKYDKIRKENNERALGEREVGSYSEGGNVLDTNARKHIANKNFALPGKRYPIEDKTHAQNALARVSQFGTPEEKTKVRSKVHAKYPNMSEGGETIPVQIDPNSAQSAQDSMRQAFHFSKGGKVINPDEMNSKIVDILHGIVHGKPQGFDNGGEVPPPAPINPDATQEVQASMRKAFHFADGGQADPITGNIDPNSFEGLAMIRNANYPPAPMDDASNLKQDTIPELTPEEIQASPIPKPASEEQLTPEDSDTKKLESEYTPEELEAQIKAEESKDESEPKRELASEEKTEPSEEDKSNSSEVKVDDKELSKTNPEIQNQLVEAQKQRDLNLAGTQLERGAAIAGAGMAHARVNPELVLGAIGEKAKNANMPVQKYEEQIANQKNDPKSDVSEAYRQLYQKLTGQQASPNWSAADMAAVSPIMEKYMQAQQLGQSKRELASEKISAQADQKDRDRQLKELLANQKAESDKDRKYDKQSQTYDKALTQTQQLLESARGNPAAAQAEKDLYSTQKVNSLIGMYGDLNKVPEAQKNLIIQEIGKIATGGVPTGHEQEALQPGTPASKLAQLWGKLQNSPSPANSGAFLNEFKRYNNNLSKDAQKVIEDKYGRIIETRKKQLGDDNYQSLQDNYVNRFKQEKNVPAIDADLSKMDDDGLKSYIKAHGG